MVGGLCGYVHVAQFQTPRNYFTTYLTSFTYLTLLTLLSPYPIPPPLPLEKLPVLQRV